MDALCSAPQPITPGRRVATDDALAVRLAADYGLTLHEFLALDPDDLIDLFWPDQALPIAEAAAART